MAKHWRALSGHALMLTEAECVKLLKKYFEKHSDEKPENGNILDCTIYEEPLQNFSNTNNVFYITRIASDTEEPMEGMEFVPLKLANGDSNARISNEYQWNGGSCYAIFATKDTTGPLAFPPPYQCVEDIEKEFKDKIDGYVDKEFNYYGRIGFFSCAFYA